MEDLLTTIGQCNFNKGVGPDILDGNSLKANEKAKDKCARYLVDCLNKN